MAFVKEKPIEPIGLSEVKLLEETKVAWEGKKAPVIPVRTEVRDVHKQNLSKEVGLMAHTAGYMVSKAEKYMQKIDTNEFIIAQIGGLVEKMKKEQGVA